MLLQDDDFDRYAGCLVNNLKFIVTIVDKLCRILRMDVVSLL